MSEKETRRKFSFLITVLAGGAVSHVLRQLRIHSADYKYFPRIFLTVIVCFILEPFRWWEGLMWKRRIRNVKMTKPPVFIIGFWRSGTTLLHNLLSLMPGASYITTYQTVFPDLLLSHSWWFKPIIGKFWPTHRPFDDVKMGMDLPQEEEIALANLQEVSFYNFLYFPKDFERFYEKELFMKDLEEYKISRWKAAYVKMIRKSFLNVKGDRFISKSPSNMARIGKLLEVFPDARFVFIYRNPYKTVESFYRFFHEVLPAVQVQTSHDELSRERVARIYTDMINRYFSERNKIPEKNLLEIRFEEFSKDIQGGLEQIFKKFDLEGFEETLPEFKEHLENQSEIKQSRYEVTPETIRWVNEYAGDIVEKLNYPKQ
jgi:hypothetical protein